MKLSKPGLRKKKLTCALALVSICLWVGLAAGLSTTAGSLPAQDWNRQNLQRIKVPAGGRLTFAVLGDNRSNPAIFAQILQQISCDSTLAFAIDLGDLVETGSVENFTSFLNQVRSHLSLPFLTVLGNHDLVKPERSAALYRQIFGPDYYSFQIKDNYFIVVNDVQNYEIGPAQWRWLEQELEKSQTAKTCLVLLHAPLFDPRGGDNRHALTEDIGRKLAGLLSKYHVTHVFAGHIHGYFSGNWDGVPYTITAGAGAPLYGADPAHFFYHYLKVTLKDGQVAIQVERLPAIPAKGTP